MIKDILKRVPGFRTGKKWKMVLAIIIYFFMSIIFFNPGGITLRDKVVYSIMTFIMIGIPFILISNLGDIRSKLPIFKRKTLKANILGGVIVFLIMTISFSMVDDLKSPQQKELDLISTEKSKKEAEIKDTALAFNEKITTLGDLDTLTYDDADKVLLIREEYEALTPGQKAFITNLDLLESMEDKMRGMVEEAALALDNEIIGLGDIESLTLDKSSDIISIRKEYQELSPEQKEYVVELALLESAEKRIKDIIVEVPLALDTQIIELGEAEDLTYDKKDSVVSLRKGYNELSLEQKELVTQLTLLESAEKRMEELKLVAEEKAEADKKVADKKAAEEKVEADKKAAEEKAEADRNAAAQEVEEEYQKWVEGQFSSWDGSNRPLVKLVKENLNDPKSFKHVETVYWDNGSYLTVKMTYRAKNAFGGLVLQNVTAESDYETQYISIVSQND